MGVIRNQRPKIHRFELVSTVEGPFRKISKIDCSDLLLARSLRAHTLLASVSHMREKRKSLFEFEEIKYRFFRNKQLIKSDC